MSLAGRGAATGARAVAGVLLAGGRSQRMGGGDKCLRRLGARTLLGHVAERLAPQVGTLILSANGDPTRFDDLGLTVVPDLTADRLGPLAGILAGIMWVRRNEPEAGWIATAAADTPFLPADFVERLSAPPVAPAIRLATSRGRVHPVAGLWPVSLASDLHAWLESGASRSVLGFAERHGVLPIAFPDRTAVDPFFNVNTPDDLEAARELLAAAGSGEPHKAPPREALPA